MMAVTTKGMRVRYIGNSIPMAHMGVGEVVGLDVRGFVMVDLKGCLGHCLCSSENLEAAQ